MEELIFNIEEAIEGGYTAKAINGEIFTAGDNINELKTNIKDAVLCHFDTGSIPKIIRMHFVRDEVFALA